MLFYQHFWNLIESDLLDFFSSLFNGSVNLDMINYVVVTLIPKVDGANLVKDFRPISLLNCIFKIFAKVLADRLAPLCTSLVDKSHPAFHPNRSSRDSIAVAVVLDRQQPLEDPIRTQSPKQ